jgi:hypothetical protein
MKESLKKDKGSMSMSDLAAKYNVSKATINRVIGKEVDEVVQESFVEEYSSVLKGDEPERVERPEDKVAAERLAEHVFMEAPEEPLMEDITQMVDDPIKRTAVMQRIMLNLDNFGPVFTFIHDKSSFVQSLHSKSLDDLDGILKMMETTRTTVNLANQMKQTFLMVGKGTEILGARFLNLKTTGFLDNLVAQKQELDMIFRELAIDYAPRFTFQTRPELRLAMLYGMTLLQVDNTNRIKDYIETASKESVDEKFGDL